MSYMTLEQRRQAFAAKQKARDAARKPLRPYQCSICSQVGHKRNKCEAGKASLVADPTPFDVQEDIREECLALSWASVQRVTA